MIKIRLRKVGKKGFQIFRLVAADSRSPRDGAFIETLGQYNPHTNPVTLNLKESRIEYWLRKGAKPTETVRALLKRTGFWLRWTLTRQGKDETVINNILEKWRQQQASKLERETRKRAELRKRRKKAKKTTKAEAQPAGSESQ